jgi:DNA adenine methylase
MKPPFAYYGGKTTLAERIVALLPDHRHYVEPFAGSLAVLLAKPPALFETVNDLDHRLMTFWRVLRERPEDLMRACSLTPHSRAEHQAAYALDDGVDDLEVARRVWVCLTQGRGGTLRRTGWRYFEQPGSTSMTDYLSTYVARMASIVDRLHHVSLECRPALDVIRAYGDHAEVLIYCDPPYLGTTRASRQYGVEMSADAEHRAFAEVLHECAAAVVLSGYPSALYDDLYGSWHRQEIAAFTGQAGTNGRRIEVLWCNRPWPVTAEALFDLTDSATAEEATG